MPPLGKPGVAPKSMLAALTRPEMYGPPRSAFRLERVPVPQLGERQVLVAVMAAGINHNNVWSALGKPLDVINARRRKGALENFHIGGTDGAGVVWACGSKVQGIKEGDHVVIGPGRFDPHASDIIMGRDQPASVSTTAAGYEDNYGTYAQFTVVEQYQILPKPPHLTWEEAASYLMTGATAYRQLMGWPPNTVRPGDPVLIWGGAGGLGSMAIQITAMFGGIPIAVVSSPAKFEHCLRLGAHAVIDRSEFDHWGPLPDTDDEAAWARWGMGAIAFRDRFSAVLGRKARPAIVFEHVGCDTLPTSIFMCDNAGMVVLCGATSGYRASLDLRVLWMRSKRLQGSHGANVEEQHRFNELVMRKVISPCLSHTARFHEVGVVHQLMHDNFHPCGNMAMLVNAPTTGLRTYPSA